MTYEEFEPLFVMLSQEKKVQDDFFERLPDSIAEAFFDNEHAESLSRQVSFLVDALITDDALSESVYSVLYGFVPYGSAEIISETMEGKLNYFKQKFFS